MREQQGFRDRCEGFTYKICFDKPFCPGAQLAISCTSWFSTGDVDLLNQAQPARDNSIAHRITGPNRLPVRIDRRKTGST